MLVQHGPGPLSPAVPITKSGHVEALRGGRHGEAGCWGEAFVSCAGKRKACAEANQSDSTRRADSPAAAEVGRRPQAPCAGGSRGSRASRRPTQPVGPRGWAHRPCTSPGPSTASSEWCGPVTRQAESYGCNPSLGSRGGGTVAGAGRATVAEWRGPDTEPRLPRPGPLPRQRIAPPLKIVP